MANAFQRSEKQQKYDRQLRLWGGHGQQRLEEAHICLLGGGPTSSETLKNLVLPNVGEFTIVDDAVVCEADLGNNFFVDRASVGKSRAETVTEMMVEMNPDVKGNAHKQSPEAQIEKDLSFFDKFSLVVACQVPAGPQTKLATYCFEKNIPFIALQTCGLLAKCRVQVREHCITESHPSADRYDLYVHPEQLANFPELQQYIDSFAAEKLSDVDHAHMPYVVILAQQIKLWVDKHGAPPKKFEEQQEFKAQIKKASRTNEAGATEENFLEAVKFAYRAYNKPSLDWQVKAVFNDPAAQNLTKDSDDFWFLVAAVNAFVAQEGKGSMPVSASIPDMVSSTESYIALKKVYEAQAAKDLASVSHHVERLLESVGRDKGDIKADDIAYFVKNARGIRCVRTRSLKQEYTDATFHRDNVQEVLEEYIFQNEPEEGQEDLPPTPRNVHWYFVLRGSDAFYARHGRYPGQPFDASEEQLKKDEVELAADVKTLLEKWSLKAEVEMNCVKEVVRYGATETHNIASYLGGIGAQVALKLLLRQYVPLNNTFLYNGIHGSSSVFNM